MASSIDFVELVIENANDAGTVSYKKMFGEYMVYCNGKPIFIICNDICMVKILPETSAILGTNASQEFPYKGAKPHYVVDVDNREQVLELAVAMERITPLPKPKKKKL